MGKFKVLLVYPNLQMVNLLPSNIAILSASLKKAGIDVRVFDTTLYRTEEKSVDDIRVEHMQLRPFDLSQQGVEYKDTDVFEDFKKEVDGYKPNLIGLSVTDDTYELGIKLVSLIRGNGIHVTAGGVRPTFSPEEVLGNENIDSVCIDEGDSALVELCERIDSGRDIKDIRNIWAKVGGAIYRNAIRKPVNLDDIPYEDFSVFEDKRFYRPMQGRVHRMIPVSMDRGCPYDCAFCAAPAKRKLYSDAGCGGYFRTKNISKILDELQFQIAKYKADYIYFNTETFFARQEKELEEFAKSYASRIGLPFWCQTRVETITTKRVRMLEAMNCDRISIGLEHGNEKFRKRFLKKGFSNEQAVTAFRVLGNSRIAVTVNNIIGFPDETRELAFDTIRLNREISSDSINAYFFVPYRGTPLRQYCIDKGYLDPSAKTDSPMRSSILNMPRFSRNSIKGLVRTFPLYVKMPESYFDKIEIAERLDAEGDAMLSELRDVYFKKYFA